MASISVPTYLNIDLKFELAPVGTRIGAFIIDWFIKGFYLFLISVLFTGISNPIAMFFLLSPFIFYSFIFEWLNKGRTLGKMAMTCRVMGIDGSYPSVYQCATRWIFLSVDAWLFSLFIFVNPVLGGFVIFSPLIGLLILALNNNNQRIGDMAANTIVVKGKQNEVYISDTIYAYSNIKNEYQPKYPQIMRLSDNDITKIKILFEKSDYHSNYELTNRLANHIKKILKIESPENDEEFLRQLLNDYNYYAIKESN
jgi:uncharacterized RDD family membrane protein YckC